MTAPAVTTPVTPPAPAAASPAPVGTPAPAADAAALVTAPAPSPTPAADAAAPARDASGRFVPAPTPAAAGAPGAADGVTAGDGAVTASVVPETYDIKVPAGSTVDAALVERTAATARALGLSNEAAQRLLDERVKDATEAEAAAKAAADAVTAAWTPGTGEQWIARNVALKAQALADPEIGGSPEKLAASAALAQQALTTFGSAKLAELLNKEGLLSHPEAIRFLANIGRRSAEGAIVHGSSGAPAPVSIAERLYGADGTGVKKPE